MLFNKDGEVFVLRCSTRWLRRNEKGRPGSRPLAWTDRRSYAADCALRGRKLNAASGLRAADRVVSPKIAEQRHERLIRRVVGVFGELLSIRGLGPEKSPRLEA